MITSPYNFVPLNDKVVTPFWAKLISHDIPFDKRESGQIKLRITAESPIYVRNGVPKDNSEYTHFNRDQNGYFIPGSSVKGMVRNVLEILSFAGIGNKVNDVKYSVRDFQNPDIYPKSELGKEVYCGWLKLENALYLLQDCGKPERISHKNLDPLCAPNSKISGHYKMRQNVDNDRKKTAKSKNDIFDFPKTNRFSFDYEDVMRRVNKIDPNGREGTIVLTGQPGVRNEPEDKKASGKHLEFIFFTSANDFKEVPDEVIKNFKFAYFDHDTTLQKDDWEWRSRQLKNGESIPVFFRKNPDNTIKDMGLTMLYKITYENSVLDSINRVQKSDGLDLSECLFGYTDGKGALKGRVQFGHAYLTKNSGLSELKTEVLAGPKASYYPNYIEQKTKPNGTTNNYKTFMDNDARISGWKRYPVHNTGVKNNPPPLINGRVNENMATNFIPLNTGAEFELTVNYHNLRKEELGALLSAITFHNTRDLFHSIGMGKPLGYGKVSVEILDFPEDKRKEFLKAYEAFMNYALGDTEWRQTPQVVQLLAMARGETNDDHLAYMNLNDFVTKKGRTKRDPKFALQKIVVGDKVFPIALVEKSEQLQWNKTYEEEKQKLEEQKPIEELKEKYLWSVRKNFENALEEYKTKLIKAIKTQREKIRNDEKQAREEEDRIQRETARKEKAEKASSSGIDFSNLDWSKNLSRVVESDITKIVENYTKAVHSVNNLSKIQAAYLTRTEDISQVKEVILKLFNSFPNTEKSDDKMKIRLGRYERWLGLEIVKELEEAIKGIQ